MVLGYYDERMCRMILFVADYPAPSTAHDGMMQRIAAIDRRFASVRRTYLKVSLVGNLRGSRRQVDGTLEVCRLNLFLHLPAIVRLVLAARCVYIHSVGNALAVLPFYLLRPTVTDLHGAVPEEFEMSGRRFPAWRYRLVERFAVRHSRLLVAVSNAMAEHMRAKYPKWSLPLVTVPIFEEVTPPKRPEHSGPAAPLVIYAGGTQPWQNVDRMIEAIRARIETCRFTILSGSVPLFREKLAAAGIGGRVTVECVPKDEVYHSFAQADFGFVLRDDILVNRVACPTKLVEYLACGVIPIVIQPEIGDFRDLGFACVTLDEFLDGRLPGGEALDAMRSVNYGVVERLRRQSRDGLECLATFCADGAGAGRSHG